MMILILILFLLIQHITFPTHYISHIPDLVVTPISNILFKPLISLPPISHTNVISLQIYLPSKHTVKNKNLFP